MTTKIGQFCAYDFCGSITATAANAGVLGLRAPGARACPAVVAADEDEIKDVDLSVSIDVAGRIRPGGGEASGNGDQVEEVHRTVGIDVTCPERDIW